MKTSILLPLCVIFCGFLLIQGKIVENDAPAVVKADSVVVSYSGKVKTIIDNKCYGCHNQASKSGKARHKLNLDSLSMLPKIARISKLDKIIETIDKNEMPPKKYLERKPEAKLSAEEAKAIKDWAQKTSDLLLN